MWATDDEIMAARTEFEERVKAEIESALNFDPKTMTHDMRQTLLNNLLFEYTRLWNSVMNLRKDDLLEELYEHIVGGCSGSPHDWGTVNWRMFVGSVLVQLRSDWSSRSILDQFVQMNHKAQEEVSALRKQLQAMTYCSSSIENVDDLVEENLVLAGEVESTRKEYNDLRSQYNNLLIEMGKLMKERNHAEGEIDQERNADTGASEHLS